jgi:putative peptidoglycan lipid II flippase
VVAWSTVAGAGLQLLIQLPWALRLARGARPSLAVRLAPVRQVFTNFAPVLVSRGVVQFSAYIDQLLASYLGSPVVAAMAYAQQLYLLPISLFGMAISAAELPEMSSELGTVDEIAAAIRGRLSSALTRMAFFVVPSTVAFLALGDVIVGLLFQTGKFGASDTHVVWIILAGSTGGREAATQGRVIASAFYALGDTRTPFWFAVVRVSIAGGLGWAAALPLRRAFGWPDELAAAGLTASAGLAGWVEFLLLRRALTARIGRFPVALGELVRVWAAALGAGGVAFGLHRLFPSRHPVITGIAWCGVYGAVYGLLALALGVGQARDLWRRVRRRRA